MALGRFDVIGPGLTVDDAVDDDANDLAATLVELGFQPRNGTQLGRADGREVFGWENIRAQPSPIHS